MTNSANRKGTMFTLDDEVIKLLNKAKAETHVPKSQIVELALQEYLKDYKSDDDDLKRLYYPRKIENFECNGMNL